MFDTFRIWLADKLDPETESHIEELKEMNDELADLVEAMQQDLEDQKAENGSLLANEAVVNPDRWLYERQELQSDLVRSLGLQAASSGKVLNDRNVYVVAAAAEALALSVFPLPVEDQGPWGAAGELTI
jgi:hypothetical protein